jgi:uncharacterized protein YecT (DUF1311 family)
MKITSAYFVALSIGVFGGLTACNNSRKENQPTATAPEDTMLLHDLAEANKNTANAAAADNSLTTLKTGSDSGAAIVGASGGPSATPETRVVSRPATTPSSTTSVQASTGNGTVAPTTTTRSSSDTRPRESNRATTQRRAERPVASTSSSGDLCDSPTMADQRACLSRSIVENDAGLNSTYQELIAQSKKSGGPELEERLREAQRAWVNDRDMACRPGSTSGLWARAVARCLAERSATRTAELRRTLSSLRGQ